MTAGSPLGYLSNLERAIAFAAVFLSTFRHLRLSNIFFSLSDMLCGVCAFFLLLSGRFPSQPLGRSTQLWGLGFLMLLTGLLGSSLVNGDPFRGMVVSGQYFFAYIVLLFVLLRDDEALAHRIAIAFLWGLVCVDLHGIFVYFGGPSGVSMAIVSGANRLNTVLANPNTAGAINALSLPMLFYLWLGSKLPTYIAMAMLAVFLTTIVFTGSNSGAISIFLGFAVFLIVVGDGRSFWRFMLILAAAAVVVLVVGVEALPEAFRNRVLSVTSSGDLSQAGTLLDRLALMREAVQIIQEKEVFLVGIGADQFRVISQYGAPVHNTYLLLLTEGGVIALFGWMLFLVIAFRIGLAVRLSGADPNVGAMVITTVIIFAFGASAHAHVYARYYLVPLFLCLSIAMVELRQQAALHAMKSESNAPI